MPTMGMSLEVGLQNSNYFFLVSLCLGGIRGCCLAPLGGGEGLEVDALLAGMCARRRSHFLCLGKESNQRKPTPLAVSRSVAAGSLRCSGAGRRCRTHCALRATFKQRQRVRAPSACFAAPAPRPALLGTARGGGEVHPGHRCARPWASLPLPLGESLPPRMRGVGVRADQFKNNSCPRLYRKRQQPYCFEIALGSVTATPSPLPGNAANTATGATRSACCAPRGAVPVWVRRAPGWRAQARTCSAPDLGGYGQHAQRGGRQRVGDGRAHGELLVRLRATAYLWV